MNKIAVEIKDGVTIYGKVIGPNNRLGKFEVHSDFHNTSGEEYNLLVDAERRMNQLIGVKNN